MLNGRAKAGGLEVDWTTMSMAKRHQRKTIGFGAYDKKERAYEEQIYIRELCLVEGGLGCALWDGSIVLARWIQTHKHLFANHSVLELGAGCGLPGILAAKYAKKVILTEYVQQLVDNITYNIDLNSIDEDPRTDENGLLLTPNIKAHTTAGFLDWFQVESPQQAQNSESEKRKPIDVPKCTLTEFGKKFLEQEWYRCLTCYPTDESMGTCVQCALYCHKGHEVVKQEASRFRCDCESGKDEGCDLLKLAQQVNIAIEPVDIILGAELTYNLLSISALINVVDCFLKDGGVFYEVLSNDRDGVSEFIRLIKEKGYLVDVVPVPAEMMGNYGTRDWTFQNTETYSFYTFRKPNSTFPIMSP